MSIGMTVDEFWNGDPMLPIYYRQAHRQKIEDASREAWLHGIYVKYALGDVLASAFNSQAQQLYPTEPIRMTPLTRKERRQKEREAKAELIRYLNSLGGDLDEPLEAEFEEELEEADEF